MTPTASQGGGCRKSTNRRQVPFDKRGAQMRWRHKKRGTTYDIVGVAALQTADPTTLRDNKVMVVYQGEDGQLWVRASDEFHDGRYEKID